MKRTIIKLTFAGFLTAQFFLFSGFKLQKPIAKTIRTSLPIDPGTELKEAVFQILDTKCNVCHRKKNPFKIFSLKNMEKNAKKIYKQVFVYRRMPKGGEIKLTEAESQMLRKWLEGKVRK